MKEEWLMPSAVVPVDSKTTAALVNEVKRLIGVVGSMALAAAELRRLHERCEQWRDIHDAVEHMTREDIIRMAREAGMQLAWIATVPDTNKMKVLCDFDQVQRFAALVAAAEREACAKVCDVLAVHPEYASDITKVAAQAIRARGEKLT